MYEQNCNSCHGLKNPSSFDEVQLGKIVPSMVQKVNKKAGATRINEISQELILRYMVTMSLVPDKK